MKDRHTIPIRPTPHYVAGHRRVKLGRDGARSLEKTILMVIGLVAIVIGGACLAFVTYHRLGRSEFFAITTMDIHGCRHTTQEEILQIAGVDIHSNLLAVKPNVIKAALESHAWIREATVSREWPDRLVITIQEKQSMALLNREDGLFYLDEEGQVIAPVTLPDDIDFPVITGLEHRQTDTAAESLTHVLRFLSYTDSDDDFLNRQALSEIHVTETDEMVLYLLDPAFPIYFGRIDNLRTKYWRLARILKNLHENGEFRNIAHIRMEYGEGEVLVGKITQT